VSSLRSRAFAYLVAGVLVSAVVTVGIGYVLVQSRQSRQAVRVLERQAEALAGVALAAGPHVYAVRANRPGGVVAVPLGRAAQILLQVPIGGRHSGQITVGRRNLLYAERQGLSGPVVLVRSAQVGPGDTPSFLLSLVLGGVAGVVVAAGLAGLFARRLVRPLAALAQASRRLAEASEPVQVQLDPEAPGEVRTLGQAFNQMSREVTAARDAQRSFLLSVSHELKTPLTAIKGHAEGLQDGAVEPRQAGDVIVEEGARLERLIGDLLDLARLDQRAFAVLREPVELSQVADQLVERFGAQAERLGVGLEVRRRAGPARVLGDPGRVLQVGSNLVENALRATPRGGSVLIEVRGRTLSVHDTGPGLAPEDVPRAFERFYLHERLAAAGDGGEHPGSGLGLAIVKELTEAMGGAATVTSTPGRGSEFSITLPA
jgi:two-component system sensor histidine kinase BaeS